MDMATPTLIAAIDSGTTGTRCIIFDQSARIVESAYEEHQQMYPQPGYVEHDAEEIWTRTRGVVGAALAKARLTPRDLRAAGITNQRETIVLWDRATGRPLYHALVWQDTRTASACARLSAQGVEPYLRALTGLPIATYFAATKLAWLLDNVPGARERAARIAHESWDARVAELRPAIALALLRAQESRGARATLPRLTPRPSRV